MKLKPTLKNILFTGVFCIALYSPLAVNAQLGGPPPPFGDNVGDEATAYEATALPIDGFILVSLLAGGVYGIKKKRKKEK